MTTAEKRISDALQIPANGCPDGDHHKMWIIDQMVRALTGPKYFEWVGKFCIGEDGPETYNWNKGIAP